MASWPGPSVTVVGGRGGSIVNSSICGGSFFSVGSGANVYVNGRRMVPADDAGAEAAPEEEDGVKEHKAQGVIRSVTIQGSASVTGSLTNISRVRISGSGDFHATSDAVLHDRFSGSVTGSGVIDLGGNSIKSLRLSVTGSGDITGFKCHGDVEADVVGSGDIRGAAIRGADVDKSCVGAGSIRIARV